MIKTEITETPDGMCCIETFEEYTHTYAIEKGISQFENILYFLLESDTTTDLRCRITIDRPMAPAYADGLQYRLVKKIELECDGLIVWCITGNGLNAADYVEEQWVPYDPNSNSEYVELATRAVNQHTLPIISSAQNVSLRITYDPILSVIVKSARLTRCKTQNMQIFSSVLAEKPSKNIQYRRNGTCENSQLICLTDTENSTEHYLRSIVIVVYPGDAYSNEFVNYTLRMGDSVFSTKAIQVGKIEKYDISERDCKKYRRMGERTIDIYFPSNCNAKTCGLYR